MAKKSRAELKAERNMWRDSARHWSGAWSELDGEYVQELAKAREDTAYQKSETLRWHGEYMGILDQALKSSGLERELVSAREELNATAEARELLQDALLRSGDEKRELSEKVAGLAVSLTAAADSRDHWRETAEAAGEKLACLAEKVRIMDQDYAEVSEERDRLDRLAGERGRQVQELDATLGKVAAERDELRRQVAGARQAAEQLNKALYPMKLIDPINPTPVNPFLINTRGRHASESAS